MTANLLLGKKQQYQRRTINAIGCINPAKKSISKECACLYVPAKKIQFYILDACHYFRLPPMAEQLQAVPMYHPFVSDVNTFTEKYLANVGKEF